MKVAILETIAPSGHEVAFDKGFYDELKKQGHKPCFFVPENYPFRTTIIMMFSILKVVRL